MDEHRGLHPIIEYAVDGKRRQDELIDAFADIQQRWVSCHPGIAGPATLNKEDDHAPDPL